MCLWRIHCESLLPKTFKGITPQLYGDFSTYTPKVHLTFLFFQLLDIPRGGSGGKCENAEPVWDENGAKSLHIYLLHL